MILGDPAAVSAQGPQGQSRITIDEVFRRLAERRPDAIALADPPNRENFADGVPRRLTYAEADRMVAAIAGRLRRMGLPTDAIIGVQLPNVAENILTILGVLRAGMIAAPLPLLWRHAETIDALARIGGKMLITCTRVGSFSHAPFAMNVAAGVFSIRYICGFGKTLPDGVVPFDDLFTAEKLDPIPPYERERVGNSAAHVAIITFDKDEGGVVPVARNHIEMLSGGLAVFLESRIAQETTIVSTAVPASFAGICLTVLPWLLNGGTLMLHHPFEASVLAEQLRDARGGALIVPAPVAFCLADAGTITNDLSAVIAPWRAPERMAESPPWRFDDISFFDVPVFGEAGLFAARRGHDGKPMSIPLGAVAAPRGSAGSIVLAELVRTQAETLGLRGPMVPHHPFPPGAERSGLPHFRIGTGGLIDTGYACRIDPATQAVAVTGAPSGIVSVGGYRFPLRDLNEAVKRIDDGASVTALPDSLVGQRLIGHAANRASVQAALQAEGFNPIVAAAFDDWPEDAVSAKP
jgi:AMP-binding enzyme